MPNKGNSKEYKIEGEKYFFEGNAVNDYGSSMINDILNIRRPEGFPNRNNCIFFHSSKDTLKKRNLVLSVDISGLEFPVYQVSYDYVADLFGHSMKQLRREGYVLKNMLESGVDRYWKNVEVVKNSDELKERMEVFMPDNKIEPKYLEVEYEWGINIKINKGQT